MDISVTRDRRNRARITIEEDVDADQLYDLFLAAGGRDYREEVDRLEAKLGDANDRIDELVGELGNANDKIAELENAQ